MQRKARGAPGQPANGSPVPSPIDIVETLLIAGQRLANTVDRLSFSPPITHIYNPLRYAWAPYERYLRRYATTPKRVVFMGMNPGPFGMVQTGIPFGEVNAVKDWLKIQAPVVAPARQHPARPVLGFDCPRREISGQRLWGFFAEQFTAPENFFREHLVMNYCPLAFLEESGRNHTPDKLPAEEKQKLFRACDEHLRSTLAALQPEWLVCVGGFAYARGLDVTASTGGATAQVCQILHPSPASPAANRGWGAAVLRQLQTHGILP